MLHETDRVSFIRPLVLIIAGVSMCILFFSGKIVANEKPVIGAIEHVIIEPYGVKVDARIDTGASTSSLDARNLTVTGESVTFNLSPKFGGAEVTVPVIAWKYVRTSRSREKRPIVEMELCIDSKKLRVLVNLTDRSEMRHALLLGRNVITGNFVVDPSRSFLTRPAKDCGAGEK